MDIDGVQEQKHLDEGAIESFEEHLDGPDGSIKYKEALQTLDDAEKSLRGDLARGVTRAEAENKKTMLEAVVQGRELLKAVWEDIQSRK